jgi:hypothetical protein
LPARIGKSLKQQQKTQSRKPYFECDDFDEIVVIDLKQQSYSNDKNNNNYDKKV